MHEVTGALADLRRSGGISFVDGLNSDRGNAGLKYQAHMLVRVQTNMEVKIAKRLNDRGIPVYVPQERWSRKSSWKKRVVDIRPIFDGLMFVPADDRFCDLQRMRSLSDGVLSFVRFNHGSFAIARPDEMHVIRRMEQRLSLPMGRRRYAVGQAVMVSDGPFGLWEGKIERLDSRGRLSVLLEMLGSQVKVHLDETQIESV